MHIKYHETANFYLCNIICNEYNNETSTRSSFLPNILVLHEIL